MNKRIMNEKLVLHDFLLSQWDTVGEISTKRNRDSTGSTYQKENQKCPRILLRHFALAS